jgi:hypothetical protein
VHGAQHLLLQYQTLLPVEVVKITDRQPILVKQLVVLEPTILFIIIIQLVKDKLAPMEAINIALIEHIALFHLVPK